MTIKRQYSLPNCKLIVEGVGEENLTIGAPRPLLSMVVNVECHFVGHEKPLVGGQTFLTSLVNATTEYAQEYLSGIRHPTPSVGASEGVKIQRVEPDTHRLVMYPEPIAEMPSAAESIQVDLQTVQLFDLVEAIDQLCADTQTLPDLSLKLNPLSRRYIVSQEPITKRAVPAAIGASGLAVAAALLFMIPVPEVRRPEPTQGEATQESPIASPAGAGSPDPTATGSPEPTSSPEAVGATTGSPDASSPEPSPEAAETGGETAAADPTGASVLDAAPAITDADQISDLTGNLRDQLDEAWRNNPDFPEDLVYRVGVAANGDILGFDYENDAAVQYRDQVPLLDLLYNPTDTPTDEPIADFRVVFTTGGRVEVSPWNGRPNAESPTPSP
ncbi:DUF4335 domain-containing protein [Oscillatoria sp. FACHB-1407]|uniref:DUF4335 domain-containing protein n=1 Tax=Oscillatoria sp. FACHB-1407 TaxID=2692847 RepID=UPI0016891BD2|nr:DUF4335 domain-containing protein [Oscillatoria sp. FACHB-1407]MBD2464628.1 DUF4335 domain-containing protein [Oscillatoria sp. FACHB-1407]